MSFNSLCVAAISTLGPSLSFASYPPSRSPSICSSSASICFATASACLRLSSSRRARSIAIWSSTLFTASALRARKSSSARFFASSAFLTCCSTSYQCSSTNRERSSSLAILNSSLASRFCSNSFRCFSCIAALSASFCASTSRFRRSAILVLRASFSRAFRSIFAASSSVRVHFSSSSPSSTTISSADSVAVSFLGASFLSFGANSSSSSSLSWASNFFSHRSTDTAAFATLDSSACSWSSGSGSSLFPAISSSISKSSYGLTNVGSSLLTSALT
mmetsp:Transcript_11111/g.16931  ORF Transcript_11111/g.16931 Transcript_11111/m.16931 type:complete len:276 (-) Transcript_11111:117-944(-)